MYKAFKINDTELGNILNDSDICYIDTWKAEFERTVLHFGRTVNSSGQIEMNKLQDDWFTTIDADIFISHSHSDEKNVKKFANYLYTEFGIKCFIDSVFWNYSLDLLKQIDEEYCFNEDKTFFNYDTRNQTTSHVHMLLATSLMQVIDKTECFLFINTANATKMKEGRYYTSSTWINFELLLAKFIRVNVPPRKRSNILKSESVVILDSMEAHNDFKPIYPLLDLDDLTDISFSYIKNLTNGFMYQEGISKTEFLDEIYKLDNKTKKGEFYD